MMMSFYPSLRETTPTKKITINELWWDIKCGLYEDQIRGLRLVRGEKQEELKKSLPAVTISGTFKSRRDHQLIKHSELICIDIDKVGEAESVKQQLIRTLGDWILICFISPTGTGIKVIFKVDPVEHSQEQNYEAASYLIYSALPFLKDRIDPSCKNISRLCFVSFDPKAFIKDELRVLRNWSAIPCIETTKLLSQRQSDGMTDSIKKLEYHRDNDLDFQHKNDKANFLKLVGMTSSKHGQFAVGNRHTFVQRLCSLANRFGLTKDVLQAYLQEHFLDCTEALVRGHEFKKDELRQIVDDTYNRYKEDFNTWSQVSVDSEFTTPLFPDNLYNNLPDFLKTCCSQFAARERDVFLVGAMGFLSTCFPLVQGTYDGRSIGMNLFFFISAPASAGKGTLHWARKLSRVLNQRLKADHELALQQYELELEEYEANKSEGAIKPKKPARPQLYIPGNSSSSSIISAMHSNRNYGIIFETEADTLTNMLKVEWGNFSDIIRKAFHHEPITLMRKTNDENLEIDPSYLSLVLSGTPKQVDRLLSSIENGFFSRFLFYDFAQIVEWKDVFEFSDHALERFFEGRSNVLNDYCMPFFAPVEADRSNVVNFALTQDQQDEFQQYFSSKIQQLNGIYGSDIVPSIKRLAVCFFRISMLFTVFRSIEARINGSGGSIKSLQCSNEDFSNARRIIDVLLIHTTKIFQQVKQKSRNKFKFQSKQVFFDSLPDQFHRATAMELAAYVGLKEKTAEKYLADFIDQDILNRPEHNQYVKSAAENL